MCDSDRAGSVFLIGLVARDSDSFCYVAYGILLYREKKLTRGNSFRFAWPNLWKNFVLRKQTNTGHCGGHY